ncbi:MAG: SDR family oxidoreductase [Thermoleophilia bacterium]|nr:SDR family oxidoreductase [Thermoleophilia bacterium]
MNGRLAGRVALVTGASSGNGRAIALRFASEGAAVLCADLREAPLAEGYDEGAPTHELILAAGGLAAFRRCDVTDGEQVGAAVEAAVALGGGLDVAVANAGVSPRSHDLVDEPWEQYELVVRANQHGVWWTCREAVRRMIELGRGGRVIAIASAAGLVGTPTGVDYNTSKGAVVQLVRTLAGQVGRHGITVNAVCPGYVRTAMTRLIWDDAERLERVRATTPLPRLGEPEDVAGACFWLASEDAAWVTGIALPVDGGLTATR